MYLSAPFAGLERLSSPDMLLTLTVPNQRRTYFVTGAGFRLGSTQMYLKPTPGM